MVNRLTVDFLVRSPVVARQMPVTLSKYLSLCFYWSVKDTIWSASKVEENKRDFVLFLHL